MGLTIGLIVVIVLLVAFLVYEYFRRKSAEALNDNLDTKEKVQDIQKSIDVNNAEIEAEKQKQVDLQKKLDEDKAKNVTKDDLLNFFNSNDPK